MIKRTNEGRFGEGVRSCGEWTPEVVYTVYCNDDLSTLPVAILKDMVIYINGIVDSKVGE